MYTHNSRTPRQQTRQVEVPLPPIPWLNGMKQRGTIRLFQGGKPPKRRFDPGSYVRLNGELLLIMYAYRMLDKPDTWLYSCQRRESLEAAQATDSLMSLSMAADPNGAVSDLTPRVSPYLFGNYNDVHTYFEAIYKHTDPRTLTTAQLNKGQIVSDGELLPPTDTCTAQVRPELPS